MAIESWVNVGSVKSPVPQTKVWAKSESQFKLTKTLKYKASSPLMEVRQIIGESVAQASCLPQNDRWGIRSAGILPATERSIVSQ